MKKVSLKDIAAAVGVAPSTVSFVLNGKGKQMRISESLSKKIKDVADKAGYHPNKIAVSLRTGTSKILGLIVEDISNNFFATLAKIIEIEAEKYGYNVVFCSTENDSKKGKQLLRILSQQQVDGYLITPTVDMSDDIRALHDQHESIVLMDRTFPELSVPCVLADNFNGVKDGMQHLIKKGYRSIAFVTIDLDLLQMKQRKSAFNTAVKEALLKKSACPILEIPVNTPQAQSVILIGKFLTAHAKLDAVFFATNYLGIAGLESLRNLGRKIPEDIAVLCFDDHDLFRLHTPAITTICQPIQEIGKNAVRILIEQIRGERSQKKIKTMMLAANLTTREST